MSTKLDDKLKSKNPFEDFIEIAKKEYSSNRTFKKINPESLNKKQFAVYQQVKRHIEHPDVPLRLICQGFAGAGGLNYFSIFSSLH